MDLTKKDKKRIEDDVDRVMMRTAVEATQYARLYEIAYYEELIRRTEIRLEVLRDIYAQQIKEVSEMRVDTYNKRCSAGS